jgi:hypothetical protein
MVKTKRKNVTTMIPRSLHTRIRILAAQEQKTVLAVLVEALEAHLTGKNKNDKQK